MEDDVEDIFYLDDTTPAEDSWTDMLVDGAATTTTGRSAPHTVDPDVLVITTNAEDSATLTSDISSDGEGEDEEKEEEGEGEGEDEDERALSDDEAVAKTPQADILAMARRTSIPILPASAVRSQSRQVDMVPSSLPIPIPAALRQLINNRGESPSIASSHSSATSSHKPTPSTSTATTSVDPSLRRSSLHALAAERRPYVPNVPSPHIASTLTSTTTPVPEHLAQRSLSPEPSPTTTPPHNAAEPFMPPHTLTAEPYFSFSKFRHLEGVKGGTTRLASSVGGGGGWGGVLSSSVPSRGAMSGMLFRKEDSERRAGGVSGLSVALGRKDLTDLRSSAGDHP